MNIKRTAYTLMVAALLAGSLAPTPPPLAPCPTEDSTGCYWDAAAQGNGVGTSFVVGE